MIRVCIKLGFDIDIAPDPAEWSHGERAMSAAEGDFFGGRVGISIGLESSFWVLLIDVISM